MQLPKIDFTRRGAMCTDFDRFLDELATRYVLFVFLKKPARGKSTAGVRYAYGTTSLDLIDPQQAPSASPKRSKPAGLHAYWDFGRYLDSARGNGWRAFYADRWLGWFPDVRIDTEEAEEEITDL